MTIIKKRVEQLTTIFKIWNENDSENQQKTINYLSEFLTSASLLQKISGDENLKEQLRLFRENFQKNFGADLRELGVSDLPENFVSISQDLRKIDHTDITLEAKRKMVEEVFSKHKLSRDEFVKKITEQTHNKYQFAHLRNALNYGEYFDFLLVELKDKASKDIIKSSLDSITSCDDESKFFASLVTLNQTLDLSKNFDKLQSRYKLDGLEEHSLINQGTQFRSNLDQKQMLSRIENEEGENFVKKTENFFNKIQQLPKNQKIDQSVDAPSTSIPTKPQITFGFEMETVITAKGGLESEKSRLERRSDYEKIIYNLADLDSRSKMREIYGFSSEKIGKNINPLILFSEIELENFRQLNYEKNHEKIDTVKKFLDEEKNKFNEDDKKIFNKALENIALLTKEEIYFLDLFYVKKTEAQNHKLTMDDVFDWRDDETKYQKKLLATLQDIGLSGGFYKKTLDMIRASEIAVGEFKSFQSENKFSKAVKFTRESAKEHNLSFQDRNVQINIGMHLDDNNIFKIYDENHAGKFQLFSNQITGDFAKIIQKTLAQTIQNNPEFERRGQGLVGIEVRVDRKKGLIEKTKNTEYFKYYTPNEANSELKPESSAFPIHRRNTGKSENIRLAKIGMDEDAVFEVRLVGNNPHCPYFDNQPRIIDNASEKFTRFFKENLEKNWQEYLTDKTPDQIQAKIDTKIAIDKNGKLEGVSGIVQQPSFVLSPLKKRATASHL
ncbi:MAG: hypothetical protein ACKN9I_05030 [Alphaproteobacteria bacterium]